MKLRKMILLPISLMLFLTGCSSTSVYVIKDTELIRAKAGQVITAKDDGWFLSDRAVDRILNARIEKVKLQ
jgi:hypothetical protein